MKNSDFSQPGGAKKFLYTGAKREQEEQEDLPWNFSSKNSSPRANPGQMNGKMKFDMEDVWSIKRNVNIGGKVGQHADEKLTYNADKSYYSRYKGGGKDKDDFDSSFGGNNTNTDSSGKSWNTGNQGRRPFSYSFGTESAQPPVSPRNTSVSSAGTYPQPAQNCGTSSQAGSGMNYGNSENLNLNSGGGTNIYSVPGRNMNNNNNNTDNRFTTTGGGGGGSVYNKSLASFSGGQADNHSPSRTYNSLFGQSANRSSLDGGSKFNRQNKSFR